MTEQIELSKKALDYFSSKISDDNTSPCAKVICLYAEDLLERFIEAATHCFENENQALELTEKVLLNGASNWCEYSYEGLSLVYNYQIIDRLKNAFDTDKLYRENNLLLIQATILKNACKLILHFADVSENK